MYYRNQQSPFQEINGNPRPFQLNPMAAVAASRKFGTGIFRKVARIRSLELFVPQDNALVLQGPVSQCLQKGNDTYILGRQLQTPFSIRKQHFSEK